MLVTHLDVPKVSRAEVLQMAQQLGITLQFHRAPDDCGEDWSGWDGSHPWIDSGPATGLLYDTEEGAALAAMRLIGSLIP